MAALTLALSSFLSTFLRHDAGMTTCSELRGINRMTAGCDDDKSSRPANKSDETPSIPAR